VAAEPAPDLVVAAVARRQHGAFSRRQALAAGFTATMITQRLASAAWLRLASGVYALASHPFSWERQAMAATLSVPKAVLSGPSAAALHDIEGFRKGRLEVTVPPGRNVRNRLAVVRRSTLIEATTVEAIPTLTLVDTLLSLAGRVPEFALERAVDAVLARRPALLGRLEDRFVAFAGGHRRGTAAMRKVLAVRSGGDVPPTSELERHLRFMLEAPGLPPFGYEVVMPWWSGGSGRVDAYSAACCLIVEADGRAWHTRERDFASDRRRDNLAVANGHAVLRFTWHDLVDDVEGSRTLVRAVAAQRGWER
jgi:hypothetical protein